MRQARSSFLLIIVAGLTLTPVTVGEEKAKATLTLGKIMDRTYDFKEAKQETPYSLYVPKTYDNSKKYPLIVALHGLGSTAKQMIRYPGFTKLAEEHGYVIVAPMGYNRRGWYGQFGQKNKRWSPENLGELSEKDVMNVLEITKQELSIDPKRIYLMGHSMGGGGTWHIAMKYPKIWAGLGPIAPAIFRSPDGLSKIKNIPVVLVQGDKDRLVPVRTARKWAEKMKDLKMTYEYLEVKGGDHIRPAIQKLPDVIAFFNKHKKK